jgi:hypothetical protein
MSTKPCQFEGCTNTAQPGWKYCKFHVQVMYQRMLDDGYLEPWPGSQEPGVPQDLADRKEADSDDGETVAAGDPAGLRHAG